VGTAAIAATITGCLIKEAAQSRVTGLSACTCQLSEVWVGSLAVMKLHSASRKAPLFNLNHLRGTACDAVLVLVLAKARLRRARAKRDERHD
jgi:hypothetical protein